MGDDWFVYAPKIDAWTSAWVRRPRWLRNLVSRLIAVPTEVPRLPVTVTVAFASEYLRQRARRDGLIDFTTSEIVPPGSDPADFPNRAPGERPWRGKLLAVGRVEPRKGFDNAVRALAELPTMTLRIVGPDSDGHAAELTRLATEIGVADSLTIDGAVPREHLAATYADADVFVFPSRWDEPFGLVPLEAMSQATPVVATRRGGSAEFLVDGVNCLEVPNDDPAAIARAVRRLATDDRLRRQLVDGGLATSDAYRIDRYAASLERIHQEAAANIR
jgi:glycosyltransferase involved in cell wall biosynthesis